MPPLGNLNSLLSGMFPPAGGNAQTTSTTSADGSASISISMGPGGGIPNLSNLLNQLGAGGPPGQGGAQPLPPFLQNIISGAGGPRPPAQPQASQNQQPPQNPAPAGAVQLPHQVLFRIGQHVNNMHGGADFPGPPMPQLQVQRNVIVLLGSYLTNLNLQLQRLQPLLSRTGDLMQRESLMTGQAER